jgi:hypothetical protein
VIFLVGCDSIFYGALRMAIRTFSGQDLWAEVVTSVPALEVLTAHRSTCIFSLICAELRDFKSIFDTRLSSDDIERAVIN